MQTGKQLGVNCSRAPPTITGGDTNSSITAAECVEGEGAGGEGGCWEPRHTSSIPEPCARIFVAPSCRVSSADAAAWRKGFAGITSFVERFAAYLRPRHLISAALGKTCPLYFHKAEETDETLKAAFFRDDAPPGLSSVRR